MMNQSIEEIIHQGISDRADEREKAEFLTLFHQAELEYELKNHLLEDLNKTGASAREKDFFDGLFEKFWKRRKIENTGIKHRKIYLHRITQIAAILIFGLILGYYLNSVRQVSAPVFYTSVAPNGSVSETYLPDGSHIFLNSGSKIKYSVDGTKGMREIYLTGEAWFKVAKMKEKPFLVHTSFYDVQVTGTQFNVKAYPDDNEVTTTLEEGSVHIQSSEKLKLANESVLKPGEQLIYNKESKEAHIQEVNTKWFTSWKDNKLVFINMSLRDLKTLLERKYGVDIEIDDPGILNYHYDGTIKGESINEVLELLKHTLPIQYQIVDQKIVIKRK